MMKKNMKNMLAKKMLAGVLAVCMLGSFTGCEDENQGVNPFDQVSDTNQNHNNNANSGDNNGNSNQNNNGSPDNNAGNDSQAKGDTVGFFDICNANITRLHNNDDVPDAVRYIQHEGNTFETYICDTYDSVDILENLMDILADMELTVCDKSEASGDVYYLTFCLVNEDRNFTMTFIGDCLEDNGTYYKMSKSKDLELLLFDFENNGYYTQYSNTIDEDLKPFLGFWKCEDEELVYIYEDYNGLYYLNFYMEDGEDNSVSDEDYDQIANSDEWDYADDDDEMWYLDSSYLYDDYYSVEYVEEDGDGFYIYAFDADETTGYGFDVESESKRVIIINDKKYEYDY